MGRVHRGSGPDLAGIEKHPDLSGITAHYLAPRSYRWLPEGTLVPAAVRDGLATLRRSE